MDMNIKQLPQKDQTWIHRSGKSYNIVCVANAAAIDHEKFPVTVVYKGADGNVWSRTADSFVRKFRRATPTNKA